MEIKNYIEKTKNPVWQATLILLFGAIAILIEAILTGIKLSDGDPLFPYQIMAMAVFVFALFNSILSISAENKDKYMRLSILSMLLLVIIFAAITFLVTNTFITELTTYRNIIFVFCLIYLMLLSIVGLIRFLLELAAKSDEQKKYNDHKSR